MGELSFSMSDLYPAMAFATTRMQTIPEAEDQNTLVDDQEAAEQTDVQQNPQQRKNIVLSLIIFVIVIILLGWK